MKVLIIATFSIAALSCAQPNRQVVHPQGSHVDNWTDDVTRNHRIRNDQAKWGYYGPATGSGTAGPFSPNR